MRVKWAFNIKHVSSSFELQAFIREIDSLSPFKFLKAINIIQQRTFELLYPGYKLS